MNARSEICLKKLLEVASLTQGQVVLNVLNFNDCKYNHKCTCHIHFDSDKADHKYHL